MSYGATQRLEEQVSILAKDASPTAIVQMSLLGPPAVPYLAKYITKGQGETEDEDAIVRALGMIADPSALPPLAERFTTLKGEQNHYNAERTSFRVTANAIRKIGTPEALAVLLTRLHEFEVQHAASTIRAFGELGRIEVISLLEQGTDGPLEAAIRLSGVLELPDAVPRLVALVTNPPAPTAGILAAAALTTCKDVPRAPLVSTYVKAIEASMAHKRPSWEGYGSRPDDPVWVRSEFQAALLSALWHSQGVDVVPDLVRIAAQEPTTNNHGAYYGNHQSSAARDAIVAFGPAALQHVEGKAIEAFTDAERAVATEVAHRIRQGEKGKVPEKGEPRTGRLVV